MTPTRYKITHKDIYGIDEGTTSLHYEKRGKDWRILAVQTGTYGDGTAHVTGPAYKTKAELLADLQRIAQQWAIDNSDVVEECNAVAWRWSEDGKTWFAWRTDFEHYDAAKIRGCTIELAVPSKKI